MCRQPILNIPFSFDSFDVRFSLGSCLSETSASQNYNMSINNKVSSYLPGQIYDADDQCYMAVGTRACSKVDTTVALQYKYKTN